MKQTIIALLGVIVILIAYIAISRYLNPYTTVLKVASVAVDYIPHELKRSAQTYLNFKIDESTQRMAEQTMTSEVKKGTYAIMEQDSALYTDKLEYIGKVHSGVKVRVVNLDGIPANNEHEGLIHIMLPNTNGDFVNGLVGYVPTRTIRFL